MIIKWILIITFNLVLHFTMGCQPEKKPKDSHQTQDSLDVDYSERMKDNENETVIPVEVMIVSSETIEEHIPMMGILEPLHEVEIVSEVSGKVRHILKQLGDPIGTKDTLAFIDDRIPLSHYRQARSQVLSAENNLKIMRLNLKSDKTLFDTDDISELEYENSQLAVKTAEANYLSTIANLELAKKTYQDTRITSPITGIISRKHIDLGTMVSPGMALYRVVDLNILKVALSVPQSMIGFVNIGSRANVIVSALSNQTSSGTVKTISPQADENTGSFLVEVHVKNTRNKEIKAGMTAKIDLIVNSLDKQLSIPDYALITKNGSTSVYKVRSERARLTDITIGKTIGSQIVVNGGLTEGDTVVVVGMKNLGLNTKIWVETIHNHM